jgi:cell pole-organizing protein PopZ
MVMLRLLYCTAITTCLLTSAARADESVEQNRLGIQELFNRIQAEGAPKSGENDAVPELFSNILTQGTRPVEIDAVQKILSPEEQDAPATEPAVEEDVAPGETPQSTPDVEVYLSEEAYNDQAQEEALLSGMGEWELKRTSDGLPIIMSSRDRSSAIEIVEGMVLGHLGRIRSIYEVDGRLEVLFTNGEILQEP